MADEKNIIVAIEIGSSKIRGAAASKNQDGSLRLLALEQIDARGCIRKGGVTNFDKTVTSLKFVVAQLERAIDMHIAQAYIGIGGQSLIARKNTVRREFATKTVVSQEMVDTLIEENRNITYSGQEILQVIPQEYKAGVNTTTEPVGMLAQIIEGRFLNIVARTELKETILRCVEGCGLLPAGFFVSPIIEAQTMLTDTERRSGCVMVNFGYGTTSVVVYKNNMLRHLAVIPLGGNNITRDIFSCYDGTLEEDEAENLKLKYGTAFAETTDDKGRESIILSNNRTISETMVEDITEARMEEILRNVIRQIGASGLKNEQLNYGLIASGSASNMRNLDKAINLHAKMKMRTLKSSTGFNVSAEMFVSPPQDGSMSVLLSMLYNGTINCVKPKESIQNAQPKTESNQETKTIIKEKEEGGKVTTETDNKFEKKKKKKSKFWSTFKQRLEDLTESVTEE